MNEEKNNVPKLRFPGFEGEWEQRKLGDVFEQTSRIINPKEENLELWSLTVEDGLTPKTERYNREFLVKKENNFKEVRPGDIVYNPMNMTLGAVGYNGMEKSVAVSGYYTTMIAKEGYDAYFINTWLKSPQAILLYKSYATGTLIEKQRVQFPTLSIIPTMFPDYEEQKLVGAFLESIDNLITLHQRKLDEIKQFKSGVLQKMFPRDGKKVPELRFSGFTDDWEQRKLSEVLDIVVNKNGNQFEKEDVLSVSDEYGCINQIKFQGRSFAGEDISNYKVVETGDIIYTRSPLKSKPYGIIKVVGKETGIVSPLYIVNKPKDGYDSQFVYRLFDSPEKTNNYLSPLVRKGAKNTMNISNDEWLSGEIIVSPYYEEQKRIGGFFEMLDEAITLHQHKLDALKELKIGLLQQMFV